MPAYALERRSPDSQDWQQLPGYLVGSATPEEIARANQQLAERGGLFRLVPLRPGQVSSPYPELASDPTPACQAPQPAP